MAKINNPQNQYGEDLATDSRVDQLIIERIIPAEENIETISESLKKHKEELTSNNKSIHVNDDDRDKWDSAVQSVTRAAESSTLLSVTDGTDVTISLSTEVATKTDAATISSNAITSSLNGTTAGTIGKAIADAKKELNDAITDKTVRINPGTNNITAELTENPNAVDSYTISVDGYTTDETDALLENKADKDELSSHTSDDDIHITASERSKWNNATATAATAIQTAKRADDSSTLITVNQSETSVSVALSDTVATKTDISDAKQEAINVAKVTADDLKTIISNSYSVKGITRTGAFTTFVLPNNFYPAGIQFNSVKIETININGTTPTEAYLGVMAFYPDGTKKKLSISDNTNISATKGNPVWYFSTPFTITEDYKLVFYILKDKESFIEPEPIVDRNVAIGAMVYDTDVSDPLDDWTGAQTDLNFGFHVNGEFIATHAYPGWPGCTLYEINHVNNDAKHFKEGEHEQLFSDDERLFATIEEFSILEKNINDINNEIETYNYSFAQSVETGTTSTTANTRGFGTLITNDITLGKVITYCHPTDGTENSNIWLKVFEKTSAPHIFKGISDASLNHKHGATLEYTFKDSDIKLEANKEYFFVFCSEEQKDSTTFQSVNDSADCCIQTVNNTTGYGGVCGSNGISKSGVIALHKIYKKPGKFAFATDLEEHTSDDSIHVTSDDKNNWNTSNIEYKALNKDVASYKDGVLTYGDGVTENINLEKTISAQYAFAKYSSSSAATISEFNLRTIKNDYTENDGANYENDCVVSDDEAVNTLANLINGRGMFLRSNLTTFNDELPCLMLGDIMFKDSKSLSNFRSPLPSLTCASGMFRGCTSLTTFRTKLPSLSRAKSMFNDDSELTTVDTCLPNLTYGNNMFSNCPKLTTVNLSSTSLSNLYDGTFMFHCNTIRDFNKFRGDLSSLETAEYMFTGCRLDLESVTQIADTIRDWSGDNSSPCEHRIGIGINSKSNWADWNKFEEQKTRITNKGWVITQWDENGVDPEESTALTYYYAKPASGYASPEYIDENGNKVTLILTNYTDCKDEYEIVSSREEAEIRFKLTKIEKVEE